MDVTHPRAPSPGERLGRPQVLTPRLPGALYRQPGICVTNEWFIVADRRYPVAELRHLRTVRGPRDSFATRTMVTAGALLVGTVVLLGVARDTGPLGPSTYLAIAGSAALLFLLAMLGYRMRPSPFELWAEYRGMTVRLFYSDSEREYGQVTRALVRAREMQRLGPASDPWPRLDPWHSLPR